MLINNNTINQNISVKSLRVNGLCVVMADVEKNKHDAKNIQ